MRGVVGSALKEALWNATSCSLVNCADVPKNLAVSIIIVDGASETSVPCTRTNGVMSKKKTIMFTVGAVGTLTVMFTVGAVGTLTVMFTVRTVGTLTVTKYTRCEEPA